MFKQIYATGMILGWMVLVAWQPSWAGETQQTGEPAGLSRQIEHVKAGLETMDLSFSGGLEVEAHYTDDDRESGKSSDITLATLELGLDVEPLKHVSGHILFLFEEGDTDPIDVDEAFIRLDGKDVLPFYLNIGRQYLPFGFFESHFISDPLTLELGETRQSSLVAGYTNAVLDIALALFNGDVNETGQQDDPLDGYVMSAALSLPSNNLLALTAGISYISNIGESDNLKAEEGIDVDGGNTIDTYVPGVAAFLAASFKDRYFFKAEYVTATEDIDTMTGGVGFNEDQPAQPAAYNIELAYRITDDLEAAIRLAGSDEAGDLLPESQYGAVLSYGLFNGLTLALEYQFGEFDTPADQTITSLTTQLALEF